MKSNEPPRWALRFLHWYCRFDVLEEVRGDLDEFWESEVSRVGESRARIGYFREVFLFIRSHTLRRSRSAGRAGRIEMWKNYFTVAFRALRRQRAYSAINLFGLALGLACTFLILTFVRSERSFDAYHPGADRIVRMVAGNPDENFDGIAKINGAWGIEAALQISGIESVARFVPLGQTVFQRGNHSASSIDPDNPASGGFFADSTVFDVFSWKVTAGDARTALVAPLSMVITESFANRWFNGENAVGETIRMAGTTDLTITAVMQDVPENSHFRFEYLISMSSYGHPNHDDWVRWNQYYTYLKLAPGADRARIAESATAMLPEHMSLEQAIAFGPVRLQPLTDIHLHSNEFREIAPMGNAWTVTLFAMLGGFILLLAAVNFVNLSTARSSIRSLEVGVRKSLGAAKGVLVQQFISESMLTAALAGFLALGLLMVLLPTFNNVAGSAFKPSDFLGISSLLWGGSLVLGIGFIAGIYPAFVLSSFRPAGVMKGSGPGTQRAVLRKGLVAIQFAISATLVMGTGLVSDQIDYIRNRPLGFDAEQVIAIPLQNNALNASLPEMKSRMEAVPGVESVSLSGNRPGGGDWGIPIQIPGMSDEDRPSPRMLVGDAEFPQTYGMTIVQGRSFDEARPADAEHAILINQEMARQLRWDDPIGKQILMPNVDREFEVIGVVQDFHFRSVREAIAPIMIFNAPLDWYSMLSVHLANPASETEVDRLEDIYTEYDPVNPFSYSRSSEQFASLYNGEERIARLLRIATLLAILVACLGLFGLTAFAVQRRTREIGIRKAVGASTGRIIALLTRETALLVAIALVPAVACVLWLGGNWLDSFAYSSGIRIGTMVVGSIVVGALALVTAGLQAWRASRLDPVKALRSE